MLEKMRLSGVTPDRDPLTNKSYHEGGPDRSRIPEINNGFRGGNDYRGSPQNPKDPMDIHHPALDKLSESRDPYDPRYRQNPQKVPQSEYVTDPNSSRYM
jgi:hypothetical protein